MVIPAIRDRILSDLDRLEPEQQNRAAELVHGLVLKDRRGTPGKELLRFAGILDDESAREIRQAIEEGCGRVEIERC